MRQAIDDFPCIGVSRMRAAGAIRPIDQATIVTFPASDVAFVVGLSHLRFPNGGAWSFFLCPCGRRCRTLRLYEGTACRTCLKARGLRNRIELIATEKRAAYHAPRRLARLTSPSPARLHPRPGRMLDRRANLEFALRRSRIVARKHGVDRAKDQGL